MLAAVGTSDVGVLGAAGSVASVAVTAAVSVSVSVAVVLDQ
jgi:hypothetical protein